MLVQAAHVEAEAAARNAVLGATLRTPHHLLPAGGFTDPDYAGVGLTEEQKKALKDDFLEGEMRQRVEKAPAEWDLYLVLPEPGDPLTDAAAAWPENRKRVQVGRLRVGAVEQAASKGPCDTEMFNPTSLLDGIEPSDDPMLMIRAEAYAVSFSRRMSQ